MSTSEGIKIYLRVRPTKNPSGFWALNKAKSELNFDIPKEAVDGLVNNSRSIYDFKFNSVIDMEATQPDVFELLAKPLIDDALGGFNATLFAYGQTGSGKTFTITGGAERYVDRGIIPRTLSYIFEEFARHGADTSHTMHISYLELYNETGYDLLDPSHETKALEDLPKVSIMEDEDGACHLRNLSMHEAANDEEALNLLFLGDTNRAISETPMNLASSRSHCIFTISLTAKAAGSDVRRHSKLHLVDLAGSERVHKTNAKGKVLNEAKFINTSLHYLEMVIVALQERNSRKGRSHIPYRNSMMTSVLRDSLGGNCKTAMVATVSGEAAQMDESISTCRFAQRVAQVKNAANVNEEVDPTLVIRRLKSEMAELQQEVVMLRGEMGEGGGSGSGGAGGEGAGEEQVAYLRRQCGRFVDEADPLAALEVGEMTFSKMRDCFGILKQMVLEERRKGRAGGEEGGAAGGRDGAAAYAAARGGGRGGGRAAAGGGGGGGGGDARVAELTNALEQRDNEVAILTNMLQQLQQQHGSAGAVPLQLPVSAPAGGGFAVPLAPLAVGSGRQAVQQRGAQAAAAAAAAPGGRRTMIPLPPPEVLSDPAAAFAHFRSRHARNAALEENKSVLRDKFAAAKRVGARVNAERDEIAGLKKAVEVRRRQLLASQVAAGEGGGGGGDDGAEGAKEAGEGAAEEDEEEQALLRRLEERKVEYKRTFQKLREHKKEIDHVQAMLEKSRKRMQKEFEDWYQKATAKEQQPASAVPAQPSAAWATPPASAEGMPGVGRIAPMVAEAKPSIMEAGATPDGVVLTGNKDVDDDILAFHQAKADLLKRRAAQAQAKK